MFLLSLFFLLCVFSSLKPNLSLWFQKTGWSVSPNVRKCLIMISKCPEKTKRRHKQEHLNISHRLCCLISPRSFTSVKALMQWWMLKLDLESLKSLKVSFFYSHIHLHAVYNTCIEPIWVAVAWCWCESTTSHRGAVNKPGSRRSNLAQSVLLRYNIHTNFRIQMLQSEKLLILKHSYANSAEIVWIQGC